jgi:hypothetical protein
MPLDPAVGFAMVVYFFEDWIPHEYYSYEENLQRVLMSSSFFGRRVLRVLSVMWDVVWDFVPTQAEYEF